MLEKWLNRIYKRVTQINLPSSLLYRSPFLRTHSEDDASQVSRQRRFERYAEIKQRKQNGQNILQISQAMNLHRETIRIYYYADAFPERQARPVVVSILDPYVSYLETRYQQGCSNASQLWREIQEQGFPGSRRMVLQWMKPRRKQPAASTPKKNILRELLRDNRILHLRKESSLRFEKLFGCLPKKRRTVLNKTNY